MQPTDKMNEHTKGARQCVKHCGHDPKFYHVDDVRSADEEDMTIPRCWYEDQDGFCGHMCEFPSLPVAVNDKTVVAPIKGHAARTPVPVGEQPTQESGGKQ